MLCGLWFLLSLHIVSYIPRSWPEFDRTMDSWDFHTFYLLLTDEIQRNKIFFKYSQRKKPYGIFKCIYFLLDGCITMISVAMIIENRMSV